MNSRYRRSFACIIIFAVVYKVIQLFLISPQIAEDTGDYIVFAENLFSNDPLTYSIRTPSYPILLYITFVIFKSFYFTIVIQVIISIIATILIFKIVYRFFDLKAALIGSLLFLFSPNMVYDSFILTESIAISLNIMLVYFILKSEENKSIYNILFSTLILIFIVFLRPQFIFYIIGICAYFLFTRKKLIFFIIVIVPTILSLLWSIRIYNSTGIFNMTSLIGYNLINHTGRYIENAPEEYKIIKEIYLEKRQENLKTKGAELFLIWEINDTLQKKLNVNKIQLSKILFGLSKTLILKKPEKYITSVWTATYNVLIYPKRILKKDSDYRFFRLSIPLYQMILGFGFITGILNLIRKNKNRKLHFLFFVLLIINLLSSILFDYGDNFRFFVSSHFILYIWAAIGLSEIYCSKSS